MLGGQEQTYVGLRKIRNLKIREVIGEILRSCHELEGFTWQRKSAFQIEFVVFVTVLEMNSGS